MSHPGTLPARPEVKTCPPRPTRTEERHEGVPLSPVRARFLCGLRTTTDVISSGIELSVGLAALVVGLAVLATIPIIQFVSLGYLLESSRRVAGSGRLRDGLVGVRTAARIGTAVLIALIAMLPLRVLVDLRHSALLLGNAQAVRGFEISLAVLMGCLVIYVSWGIARGSRLRHFLWPAP